MVVGFLLLLSIAVAVVVDTYKAKPGSLPQPETAIPAISAQPTPSPEETSIKTHTVQAGETLWSIANAYQIDVETLYGANQISDNIHPGDQLRILPVKGILHVVQQGETLWGIARIYGISISSLMNVNNKTDNSLVVSEQLIIPGVTAQKTAVSRGASSRMLWPTYGEISSPFGYRWGRLHAGIDIADDEGNPVKAAMAGKITYAGWQSGYGYTIIVEHSSELSTLYGHLSGFAATVGEKVAAGQVIAYVGSTGNSTGPHLHFEVRQHGYPVNPLSVLP